MALLPIPKARVSYYPRSPVIPKVMEVSDLFKTKPARKALLKAKHLGDTRINSLPAAAVMIWGPESSSFRKCTFLSPSLSDRHNNLGRFLMSSSRWAHSGGFLQRSRLVVEFCPQIDKYNTNRVRKTISVIPRHC